MTEETLEALDDVKAKLTRIENTLDAISAHNLRLEIILATMTKDVHAAREQIDRLMGAR